MTRSSTGLGRILVLRTSAIHGKGVFARKAIPEETRIVEYTGERVTAAEGEGRYPFTGLPYHTLLFEVDEDLVIDGGRGGNISRWLNHSCDPNCRWVIEGGRVYVHSTRPIEAGAELTCDYGLRIAGRHTPAVKRLYPCFCGAPRCRGTQLAAKR